MRKLITGLAAFATLAASTTPAFAGTEVFNSYKTTNEYGTRHTTINVDQDNYSKSVINSQSIKLEA